MHWVAICAGVIFILFMGYTVIGALLDLYEECRYRDEYDEDM